MKNLELLAPAGSPEALDAAVAEGADAVYLGLKSFNARMRSANFAWSQFEAAVRALHRMGRKLYVTVNTVFEQREADRMYQLLKYLAAIGPDGLIVQDFGVVKMVRDNFPSLKVHASTQMNIASSQGVNLLSKYGVSRVVLARELSLEEIRDIRANTNAELEVFVHGALCVSASGLCLFSSFLGGKSANRGMCTQACRRLYYQREGEGGYYFSPRDLQLLELLPELADAGVNSFKIEGRMKSADYVGTVVSAYRRLIDGLDGDREGSLREAAAILENDFARRKTRFYMLSSMASGAIEDSPTPDWLDPAQDGGTGIALGTLRQVKGSGEGRQGFLSPGALSPRIGDSVRLHRADDSERKAHKLVAVEKQEGGLWISIPEGFESGDSVYLIQTRSMSKRYPQVIKGDPDMFRRVPGRECAPELELPRIKKADSFPEGVYVAVSCIEDLYVLQSVRPLRVMLPLSRKTLRILLNRRPAVGDPGGTESLSGKQPAEEKGPRLLPFSPGETVLVLDPWFPQSAEKVLKEEIPHLRSLGYHQYVVNNPGHFALFRNGHSQPVNLIAGPYLYAFNRWAAAFVASQGVSAIISPLENNRQNLERTLSPGRRNSAFVTLFSRPALFRIRADLGAVYDFEEFTDSRGEEFRLISSPDGSQVIPERPFNIMDKRPFLEEAGFRRFILDLSGPPLKKKDYRNLMAFYRSASPIPSSCRFNWKDGFYSTETPGGKTVIS